MESATPSSNVQGTSTLDSPGVSRYSYLNDKEIKASFLQFSTKIHILDKQLGAFANKCSALGRVAGLLLEIKRTREMIRRTREVFFRNATTLLPSLYDLARKHCNTMDLISDGDSEQFHIPNKYFHSPELPFEALPNALEKLAKTFGSLQLRITEFREFTDEGLLLKSLLLTFENDLMYRASCVRVYSNRLNTPPIQRYVHQFTEELQVDFERLTVAVEDFTDVGISAISNEQERSSSSLSNILTVATFFSGVTAGTLSMSVGNGEQTRAIQVSSMLWFGSLAFSVGAALNSLLAMAWKETKSGSRGKKLPVWVTMWIDGSQLVFLGISIVTFSAGLVVFSFASQQPIYTPYVTIAATAVTFTGLTAILLYMMYEIIGSPAFVQHAGIIKTSGESIHSEVSKLPGAFSNKLSSLRFLPYRGDEQEDVESLDDKGTLVDDDPPREKVPGRLKNVFRSHVKDMGILSSATSAFVSSGQKSRQRRLDAPQRLQINTADSNQTTTLSLPQKPSNSIDFTRYGNIKDIAYSEDGYWLAVTCVKESKFHRQSWTTVLDARNLQASADVWHERKVISERLIWSPFGKKLIIKFDRRYDVWDLDANKLQSVEPFHEIQDVAWCDENTVLVAEHNCVYRMSGTKPVTEYRFDHMHLRSIALEAKNNHLIMIARVAKTPDQIIPASSQSEKRIVIYDLDKLKVIYQIPVLEDIFRVQPIAGELDMLVTHKDHKHFQLWTLDAGVKGAEITALLRKRSITPHDAPTEYVGPTRIIGNYDQFILSGTSSGALDIWRRGSGTHYERFEPQLFQEGRVSCFSWRRAADNSATFATAGVDSSFLCIWRGEELIVAKTPSSFECTHSSDDKARNMWQNAIGMTKAPSPTSAPP